MGRPRTHRDLPALGQQRDACTPCVPHPAQASWHVGEPFTETYTKWALAQVGSCVAGQLAGRWTSVGRPVHQAAASSAALAPGPGLPSDGSRSNALHAVQAAGRDTTGGHFDEKMYR